MNLKTIATSTLLVSTLLSAQPALVVEDANVRVGASFNSDIIRVAKKGDILEVIKKVNTKKYGTWYKTKRGYVSLELLLPLDEVDDKVKGISKDPIEVYKEPSKSSTLITTIQGNDSLEVYEERVELGEDYLWYRTDKGWINVPYLNKPLSIVSREPIEEERLSNVIQSLEDNQITNSQNEIIVEPKKLEETKVKSEDIKDVKIEPKKVEEKKPPKIEKTNDYRWFVSGLIGYGNISINKDGDISTDQEYNNDNTLLLGVDAGVKYKQNYSITLGYEYIDLDEADITNYVLGVNYHFIDIPFNPFIGVIGGISVLDWSIDPLGGSDIKDETSKASGFVGLKAASEINIKNNLSFLIEVVYEELFHTTNLEKYQDNTTIKHDRLFSMQVGLRYFF